MVDSSNRNGYNFVDVSRSQESFSRLCIASTTSSSRNDDSAIWEIGIELGIALSTTRSMLYSILLVVVLDDDWRSRDNTSDIFSFPVL